MTTSRGHRTALVTGGSRGIGRGIALTLAQKGYDVALTYATARDSALEVARLIQDEYDRECYVMQASLEDPRIPAQVVQWAIESLGHLDVWSTTPASLSWAPSRKWNRRRWTT